MSNEVGAEEGGLGESSLASWEERPRLACDKWQEVGLCFLFIV